MSDARVHLPASPDISRFAEDFAFQLDREAARLFAEAAEPATEATERAGLLRERAGDFALMANYARRAGSIKELPL